MYTDFEIDCSEFAYKNNTMTISVNLSDYQDTWRQIVSQMLEHDGSIIAEAMVNESPMLALNLVANIAEHLRIEYEKPSMEANLKQLADIELLKDYYELYPEKAREKL